MEEAEKKQEYFDYMIRVPLLDTIFQPEHFPNIHALFHRPDIYRIMPPEEIIENRRIRARLI